MLVSTSRKDDKCDGHEIGDELKEDHIDDEEDIGYGDEFDKIKRIRWCCFGLVFKD